VRVPFSGGLLLGQGFIRTTYVHMGFHPAWKFEKVAELLLEHGGVTSTLDRSAELAPCAGASAVVRNPIQTGRAVASNGSSGLSASTTAAASPGRSRQPGLND
jgi:hypothetical protein